MVFKLLNNPILDAVRVEDMLVMAVQLDYLVLAFEWFQANCAIESVRHGSWWFRGVLVIERRLRAINRAVVISKVRVPALKSKLAIDSSLPSENLVFQLFEFEFAFEAFQANLIIRHTILAIGEVVVLSMIVERSQQVKKLRDKQEDAEDLAEVKNSINFRDLHSNDFSSIADGDTDSF